MSYTHVILDYKTMITSLVILLMMFLSSLASDDKDLGEKKKVKLNAITSILITIQKKIKQGTVVAD